jgi:hypothetical protein
MERLSVKQLSLVDQPLVSIPKPVPSVEHPFQSQELITTKQFTSKYHDFALVTHNRKKRNEIKIFKATSV